MPDGVHPARWWSQRTDGRLQCDLCPRECHLHPGQRGFCFVRENQAGQMVLTSYGRASGFCLDPIEKKPLNHFLPGTSVLSFGTAGCNLGCKFCQNWNISKAREMDSLCDSATPEAIAHAAANAGASSVAFTYNDPVIFAEYVLDTASACRERGIKTVAVTAGYISEPARPEFFAALDAANVDLKAFSQRFYNKLCFAALQPVLDTLLFIRQHSEVWLEITTLLIPGENDSEDEVNRLCAWVVEHMGEQTPLHFTAFHPDFKLRDRPPTPLGTLLRARAQALGHGLKHVYTGNVNHQDSQSTYCAQCKTPVIERDWFSLGNYRLDEHGNCQVCGHTMPGYFASAPGTWGARRKRLRVLNAP